MEVLLSIIAFVFGAIIGSFLNVVALRFNSGKTLGGRSMCMTCGRTLTALELIPVVSFLIQRGRCRKCHSRISWQYPLVEAITGALFALILTHFPIGTLAQSLSVFIYIVSSCLLVVISVYDIKHTIIPDQLVYTFDALALASVFVGGSGVFHGGTVLHMLAGPILAAPFALIWLVSRGKWMGLGDAKLTLGIGWLLGLGAGINALILAFWIAAFVSIAWIIVRRGSYKPGMEIPFGPFLILGLYIVLFWHTQIIVIAEAKDILRSIL